MKVNRLTRVEWLAIADKMRGMAGESMEIDKSAVDLLPILQNLVETPIAEKMINTTAHDLGIKLKWSKQSKNGVDANSEISVKIDRIERKLNLIMAELQISYIP